MRGRLRMTPIEKRLVVISLVGFFVLLGVLVNDLGSSQNQPDVKPRSTKEFPLDLNKASEKDFEKLPMIGPVKAKAIVEYREKHGGFKSVEELLEVPGIGEKTLQRIKPYLKDIGESSKTVSVRDEKVNVNTASIEELKKLPGIGEVKAKRIVENRPYKGPKDLLKVPGIGEKTLKKIIDLIVF